MCQKGITLLLPYLYLPSKRVLSVSGTSYFLPTIQSQNMQCLQAENLQYVCAGNEVEAVGHNLDIICQLLANRCLRYTQVMHSHHHEWCNWWVAMLLLGALWTWCLLLNPLFCIFWLYCWESIGSQDITQVSVQTICDIGASGEKKRLSQRLGIVQSTAESYIIQQLQCIQKSNSA